MMQEAKQKKGNPKQIKGDGEPANLHSEQRTPQKKSVRRAKTNFTNVDFKFMSKRD